MHDAHIPNWVVLDNQAIHLTGFC